MWRTISLFMLMYAASASAQQAPAYSCNTHSGHRQFDFWLGQWEVTDQAGETVYGRNDISRREADCLLVEHWQSSRGSTGTSLNYYNPVTRAWHQDWVDASSIINTSGALQDGAMKMSGTIYYFQDTRSAEFRGSWTPLDDGRVRQFYEEKDAQGQWQVWFDGYYRRPQ